MQQRTPIISIDGTRREKTSEEKSAQKAVPVRPEDAERFAQAGWVRAAWNCNSLNPTSAEYQSKLREYSASVQKTEAKLREQRDKEL